VHGIERVIGRPTGRGARRPPSRRARTAAPGGPRPIVSSTRTPGGRQFVAAHPVANETGALAEAAALGATVVDCPGSGGLPCRFGISHMLAAAARSGLRHHCRTLGPVDSFARTRLSVHAMRTKLLAWLIVLLLTPAPGELTEWAMHFVRDGDFVHSGDSRHQLPSPDSEHGCSPILHICGCHAAPSAVPKAGVGQVGAPTPIAIRDLPAGAEFTEQAYPQPQVPPPIA
jgi:hypothetical protein